jgi:hypothetical protein
LDSRQFFSFDAEDKEVQDTGDKTEDTSDSETPILPDVPTNEPVEAGQPDAKKRKVEGEDSTTGAKAE